MLLSVRELREVLLAGLDACEQQDEVLGVARELEAFVRRLPRPHRKEHAHELADCLEDVARGLRAHGCRERALELQQHAVDLRSPGSIRFTDPYHSSNLGSSLWLLADDQRALGRRRAAVGTSKRAVNVWGWARTAGPELEPGYGISLAYLARDLASLGRWQRSLKAAEEAVAVHRKLAAGPDLAEALQHLATALAAARRTGEAAAAAAEADAIQRAIAA